MRTTVQVVAVDQRDPAGRHPGRVCPRGFLQVARPQLLQQAPGRPIFPRSFFLLWHFARTCSTGKWLIQCGRRPKTDSLGRAVVVPRLVCCSGEDPARTGDAVAQAATAYIRQEPVRLKLGISPLNSEGTLTLTLTHRRLGGSGVRTAGGAQRS